MPGGLQCGARTGPPFARGKLQLGQSRNRPANPTFCRETRDGPHVAERQNSRGASSATSPQRMPARRCAWRAPWAMTTSAAFCFTPSRGSVSMPPASAERRLWVGHECRHKRCGRRLWRSHCVRREHRGRRGRTPARRSISSDSGDSGPGGQHAWRRGCLRRQLCGDIGACRPFPECLDAATRAAAIHVST